MKNFKTLSRKELKDVFGGGAGDPCSVAIQRADGSWYTRQGTCAYTMNTTSSNGVTWRGSYYCDTGTGNSHVITSNGGVSRCNNSASTSLGVDVG